jgi:hypothetical protein
MGNSHSQQRKILERKVNAQVGEKEPSSVATQVMKGEKKLLLCVDIEGNTEKSNEVKAENPIEISIPDIFSIPDFNTRESFSSVGVDLSLSFMSGSEDIMDKNVRGLSPEPIAVEPSPAKPEPIVELVPNSGRRRMSRLEQFSALEKSLPGVKLDQKMKKSVAATMIDMNIWTEEDDENEIETKRGDQYSSDKARKVILSHTPNKSPTKGYNGNLATAKAAEGRRKSVTAATPIVASALANVDDKDSAQHAQKFLEGATAPTLAVVAAAREKVPMQRPSQIPINEQGQQRDERQRAERDTVREAIVCKAVNFLVDLNKKQDEESRQELNRHTLLQQQQQLQTLSMSVLATKPPKEVKAYTIKKLTASLVDRAIKRGRNAFKKGVENHLAQEWRYERKRTQAANFLRQAWRRHCDRHDVAKILAIGREVLHAKKIAEIEEQYNYRVRVAQRRMWEQSIHKEWLEEQRDYPTFPLTKRVKDRDQGPIKVNDEGLAISTADERLFSQDFEYTRPDLAPFSTNINSMISSSLQDVKRTLDKKKLMERSMELFAGQQRQQSMQFSPRSRFNSTSADEATTNPDHGSNVAPTTPQRITATPKTPGLGVALNTPQRIPVTPKTPRTMQVNARMFDFPSTPISVSFPTNGPVSSSNTPHLKKTASKLRVEDSGECLIQLSLPQRVMDRTVSSVRAASLVGWEEMARLDNLPSVEEIRKSSNTKSAAYKVLERLCGLSEEDIMRSKLERLKHGKEEVSLANSKFLFV